MLTCDNTDTSNLTVPVINSCVPVPGNSGTFNLTEGPLNATLVVPNKYLNFVFG